MSGVLAEVALIVIRLMHMKGANDRLETTLSGMYLTIFHYRDMNPYALS